MDLAIYNHDGETKTIHLMEVDPEIYHVATETSYWEKRRAYFKPTVAGTYYLKATLKGSAYQNPTYTVRVRKADDYAHIQTGSGRVTVGGSVRGHFYTEHGDSQPDEDWIHVNLTGAQTYLFTLTGHATANTQMRILRVNDSVAVGILNSGADAAEHSSTVSMRFTPSEGGDYYVALGSRQHVRRCQSGTNAATYKNEICAVQAKQPAPDYTFSVVED